jgi:predicted dehydrogenase
MNVAFLGCGYVAEQYAATLPHHPELRPHAAFDVDRSRLETFARRTGARAVDSLEALLADRQVELVVNLTDPRRHYETTRACLEAGKHVYSEKPLAMASADAEALAALAGQRGVRLASAPCSVLGESAQTLWRAVRTGVVGPVRVVYAAFDDGMIAPQQRPWEWKNDSGVAWPAKAEFETGSTYQHAGYVLTWLCAMFGRARRVTAFASVQVPDKGLAVDTMAPDFSVGCLEFDDGVVARVTCGLAAPRDKSIVIVGDRGVLSIGNVRDDAAPVMFRPASPSVFESLIRRRARWLARWSEARLSDAGLGAVFATSLPLVRPRQGGMVSADKRVDFLRGPAEMAEAVRDGREPRLSAAFGAHLVELIERLQYPDRFRDRDTTSTFEAMPPMPWAT